MQHRAHELPRALDDAIQHQVKGSNTTVERLNNGIKAMTNQARRVNAEQALNVYLASKGQRYDTEVLNEDVVALIIDLLHLVAKQGYEPTLTASQSVQRYHTEVNDDDND